VAPDDDGALEDEERGGHGAEGNRDGVWVDAERDDLDDEGDATDDQRASQRHPFD
jgi:hypothetical protein